jgi:hypothetical protein
MSFVITHGDPVGPSILGLVEGSMRDATAGRNRVFGSHFGFTGSVRVANGVNITDGDVGRLSTAPPVVRAIGDRAREDRAESNRRIHRPHLLCSVWIPPEEWGVTRPPGAAS